MIFAYLDNKLFVRGGKSPWKGVRYGDPHFSMFEFFMIPFQQKSQFLNIFVLEPNFSQNFRSKASNLAKIQFFKPHFFSKNSVRLALAPIFGAYPFFKPPFATLRAAHQNESYPRAFLYIAGIEGGLLRVAHPKTTFQYECRPQGCSIKAYDFFFWGGEEVIDWPYFSAEFLSC